MLGIKCVDSLTYNYLASPAAATYRFRYILLLKYETNTVSAKRGVGSLNNPMRDSL